MANGNGHIIDKETTRKVAMRLVEALLIAAAAGYTGYIGMQNAIDDNSGKILMNSTMIKENRSNIDDLNDRTARAETRIEIVESRVERAEDRLVR